MKKVFSILVVVAVVCAVVFVIYSEVFKKAIVKKPTMPPMMVSVVSVKSVDRPLIVESVGTLIPVQQVNLTAEVSGYITKINFQSGQYVKQSDLIVQLDELKARADYLAKESAYHAAFLKNGRAQKILSTHLISQQDVDTIQSDMQAKLADRDRARDVLNKTAIRAPFSGYLGKKTVNMGDYITTGKTIVNLVDRSLLKVEYAIPEGYLSNIQKNQLVSVITNAFPGKAFEGKVSFISPAVDAQSHMITLQADIDNTKDVLAPGLYVQVKQTLKNQTVLVIPEQSIVRLPDKVIVYRVIDKKAVATPVKTGATQEGLVEVTAGLSLGDQVITAGTQDLKDHQPVVMSRQP